MITKPLNYNNPINIKENDFDKFNTITCINAYSDVNIILNKVTVSDSGYIYNNNILSDYSYPFPYEVYKKNISKNLKSRLKNYIKKIKNKFQISYCSNPKYLLISDEHSYNYFHWFSESISRLLNFYENNTDEEKLIILLPTSLSKYEYISKSLDLLGFEYEFIKNKSKIFVETLYVAPHLISSGHHNENIMKKMKNLFLENNTIIKDNCKERVYITRKNAGMRKILNEDELTNVLKKYNFEIIQMENFNWMEQIGLMKNVKFLIAPHGAGLTNMLFTSNKLSILELLPLRDNNTLNNCFYSLSSSLGYNYYYQFPEKQIKSSKGEDGGESNMIINIEFFEKNLSQMLESR